MEKYSYLAGVLDMQGQFLLRPIDRATIAICTIDLEFLGTLPKDFGGEINILKPATEIARTVYRWSLSDRQLVLNTLEGIMPHLRTNMQHQAEILLHYLARQPIHPRYYHPTYYEYREYQQVELALRSLRNVGRPGWGVPFAE